MKSLLLVNFSMSHFEHMILTLPIYVFAPRWAPIVVNPDKITPMETKMCGAKEVVING